jgi:hypothetical protein
MNYESTLRALLEDAGPALRNTVKDALVRGLLDDQRSVLFDVLRKAYDLGYREALAKQPSRHQPESPGVTSDDEDDLEPENTDDGVPSVPPDPEDVEDDEGDARDPPLAPKAEGQEVDWSALGQSDDSPGEAARQRVQRPPPLLRVRSSLTIGSLRNRVVKLFELERFDIDVVICRKGDKSRRQLKSSVRLAKYELPDDWRKLW